MKHEIKVPSVGESVTKGVLSAWLVSDGGRVEEGSDLFELETDKATVTVPAPASGTLSIGIAAGAEVAIGSVVGAVDTEVKPAETVQPHRESAAPSPTLSPAVRRIVEESGLDAGTISGTGRGARITKEDALKAAVLKSAAQTAPSGHSRAQRRVPLSTIRKRTAEKLVEAQRNTAYLTTFSEVDMEAVMRLRARYREEFERAHGVRLGFVSFFVKACCRGLKEFPEVNAMIEGGDILYNDFSDIGVAVSTDRGLLVPVIRGADGMSMAEIEASIADLAARARDKKILPDELSGGTFTITNGGVFGSLLSTPLPNYPQSAILGMHAIQRRPVAVGSPESAGAPDGQGEHVAIKPMMYTALSYDHRLIDGKDAVSFLRRVKELVEDPARLLLEV